MSPLAVIRVCAKTTKITVGDIRVHHGPFRGGMWGYPGDASNAMPSWFRDSGQEYPHGARDMDNRIFGFHTLRGLRYFSRKDRKIMQNGSFGIRVFMCPPGTFKMGKEQVVFDPAHAIQTRRFRPLPVV